MAELIDEMTAGDGKSLQQINTSLDDDTIIDMLNSSKLQRYFGVEIESEIDMTSKYRRNKIKQLFNNNERKGTAKSRRSRTRSRKRQNTKYHNNPSASSKNIHKSSSNKSKRSKNGRSRSVGSMQTKQREYNESSAHGHSQSVLNDKNTPKKVHRLVSWFEKLNYTPSKSPGSEQNGYNIFKPKHALRISNSNNTPISRISNDSDGFGGNQTPSTSSNHHKINWRPPLKQIYKDQQLLNSLIAFMERTYCEENILFLQSVQEYKCKIDQYIIECNQYNNNDTDDDTEDDEEEEEEQDIDSIHLSEQIQRNIDFQIISIYNAYIVSNAQYQVNLSYDCFMNSLSRRENISDLSVHNKRCIFDICVDEIERLLLSSVLGPFYDSAEFAVVAQQRLRNANNMQSVENTSGPLLKQKSLFLPFKHNKSPTDTEKVEKRKKNRSRNPFSRMYSPAIKKGSYDVSTSSITNTNTNTAAINVMFSSKSVNNKYDLDRDGIIDVHTMCDDDDDDDDDDDMAPEDIDSDIDDFIHNENYISDDDMEPPYSLPTNDCKSGSSFKHSTPPIKLNMSHSTESLFEFEFVKSSKKPNGNNNNNNNNNNRDKGRNDSGYSSYLCHPHNMQLPSPISSCQYNMDSPRSQSKSPLSLSQSKSEQFEYLYCEDRPSTATSADSHRNNKKYNFKNNGNPFIRHKNSVDSVQSPRVNHNKYSNGNKLKSKNNRPSTAKSKNNRNPFSKRSPKKTKNNGNPFSKRSPKKLSNAIWNDEDDYDEMNMIKPTLVKTQSNSIKSAKDSGNKFAKRISHHRSSKKKRNKNNNNNSDDHNDSKHKQHKHRKTYSDVGIIANKLNESTTQKLNDGAKSTKQKYMKSRTKSPRFSKEIKEKKKKKNKKDKKDKKDKKNKKEKKDKKSLKKQNKRQTKAADDGTIKHQNKMKKRRISSKKLKKRRRSNNDSDTLSMLFTST